MKDTKLWIATHMLSAALLLPGPAPGVSPPVRSLTEATGAKRIAAILFYPPDLVPSFTREQAREFVFGERDSADALYREISGGRGWFEGDVFGWYPLAEASAGSCPYFEWSGEVAAMAAADGFDPSNYDLAIYAFPFVSRCGFGGRAHDRSRVFINESLGWAGIVVHEIAHTDGLGHADAWRCTDATDARVAIAPSNHCHVLDYEDPFDLMGLASNRPHHPSAFGKRQAGWLPEENGVTVAGDGIYTIAPHEQFHPGPQLLSILRPNELASSPYRMIHLDFRQPFGADDFDPGDPAVNGVMIHVAPALGGYRDNTLLLDATPETDTFTDAPLPVGRTFTDAENGITVTTLAVSPEGATVEIHLTQVESGVGMRGSTLTYTAPPWTRNRVTVRVLGGHYVLVDTGAVLNDTDGPGGCEVSAHRATCPVTDVTDLRIATGDERDTITLHVSIPTVIDAGAGDDRVHGGRGDDEIDGGPDRDTLVGDRGNDTLRGGPGNDRLTGGAGTDTYFGDGDDDTIQSRDGVAEPVSCGPGRDAVVGDASDDLSECAP